MGGSFSVAVVQGNWHIYLYTEALRCIKARGHGQQCNEFLSLFCGCDRLLGTVGWRDDAILVLRFSMFRLRLLRRRIV